LEDGFLSGDEAVHAGAFQLVGDGAEVDAGRRALVERVPCIGDRPAPW